MILYFLTGRGLERIEQSHLSSVAGLQRSDRLTYHALGGRRIVFRGWYTESSPRALVGEEVLLEGFTPEEELRIANAPGNPLAVALGILRGEHG